MRADKILGIELNEKFCQISYYEPEKHEPETLEVSVDNFQIPMILGKLQDEWVYGKDAVQLASVEEKCTVSDLYTKAVKQEKVKIGGQVKDGVWLLAKYLQLALERFENIERITFSVPKTDIDISKMLKGMGRFLGIPKENIAVQDFKESFCHYMFYQPKELWQYEAALFYCDRNEIRAYMLRKLKTVSGRGADMFVTVDQVANAQMKELAAVYPVLNADKAKDADERFRAFIQSVFEKKVVSSVFLTGEGFENNWYPLSLKVLCNGRRAFIGNNLYSKGACYHAWHQTREEDEIPVYLDDSKMMEQVCLRMRVHGKEGWYPIVQWGSHWYESDGQWEVLLEDTSDIEIHIESLATGELEAETVSLEGLKSRRDYALRLQIETIFLDERTCKIIFKDIGFGEFYPASDFQVEKIIHLGGSHGQFNSLS